MFRPRECAAEPVPGGALCVRWSKGGICRKGSEPFGELYLEPGTVHALFPREAAALQYGAPG